SRWCAKVDRGGKPAGRPLIPRSGARRPDDSPAEEIALRQAGALRLFAPDSRLANGGLMEYMARERSRTSPCSPGSATSTWDRTAHDAGSSSTFTGDAPPKPSAPAQRRRRIRSHPSESDDVSRFHYRERSNRGLKILTAVLAIALIAAVA